MTNNVRSLKNNRYRYVLFILFACLVFFAFNKNKDYNNLKNVLLKDKEDLEIELNQIVDDYKQLNVKNKKLSKRVIREINKIITLKKTVTKLEVENFELIRGYRKQIVGLQKENRLLITKVDSLNRLTIELKEENISVNESLNEKNIIATNLKNRNKKLLNVNKKLETELAPAREIKTSPIKAIAMKEKNSGGLIETYKHNRTDVFRVNFSLLENDLTKPGNKKIYIQIIDEDYNVVGAREQVAVLKNLEGIKYSDALIADYKNQKIEVLSLILVNRKHIKKGEYTVNVYIDGVYSSGSIITLK